MEAIIGLMALGVLGTIVWFIYKAAVVAKNTASRVASTARQINTRLSDAIACKKCGTAIPTVGQLACPGCGFTKTRNLASACPNCGRKAGFVPCPNCGDSVVFG